MQIRNVARVDYSFVNVPQTVLSNEAAVAVQAAPSRATVEILRYAVGSANSNTAGPTACAVGNAFSPLPAPQVAGAGAINPLAGVPLSDAPFLHAGDAIFIRVTDTDRNLDGAVLDTIELRVTARGTSDSERIRLTETGPNTGVFTGYLPTRLAANSGGAAANCALDLLRDTDIEALYVDPQDATDVARDAGLVDPSGVIFDSTNGVRVDGVRVRLVDAASGAPATVLGDDGVSRYPTEMITGQPVTDSGGTVYVFPAGAFRFPLVAPGNYRLVIDAPAGFAAPSIATPASLVSLPGGPYRIQDGSFGRPFTVLAPAGAALDVPLDPVSSGMSLAKTTATSSASIGDVVEYQLQLTNDDRRANARDVVIEDRLPVGLLLRAGSVRIDGVAAADPVIGADGRTLRFAVPVLLASATVTIRYAADVVPGPTGRELVNSAEASATGGTLSNAASARIALRDDFYRQRAFVLGRVYRGGCDALTKGGEGQEGIRVYLESGRYAVTDSGGRYHFENLTPGTHVVQVDTATVPQGMELVRCVPMSRDGGRNYGRFVELRAGELQQVDFALRDLPPPQGQLELTLTTAQVGEQQFEHRLVIAAQSVPLSNARVLIVLPGSFAMADAAHKLTEGAWMQTLGALRPGETRELKWQTRRVRPDDAQPEIRAVALYDSPGAAEQRSKPAINRLAPGAPPPRERMETAKLTLQPKFSVLGTDLAMEDSAALSAFARKYRKARVVRATVAGHADATPISKRNQALFADNLALSRARAEAVGRWLQKAFDLTDEAITIEAYGDQRPVAPGKDAASLARNRRVEVELQYEQAIGPADEDMARAKAAAALPAQAAQLTDTTRADTIGSWKREAITAAKASLAPVSTAANDVPFEIEKLPPKFVWLSPALDYSPPIPSVKIAIAHPYGTHIDLSINGFPVSELNFDGVATNAGNKTHVSRWRGVDLRDGENLFIAKLVDPSDTVVETIERRIHFAGGAVRAELAKSESRLLADGREKPVIALKLFDAYGEPARPGMQALFSVDAPYRSWWEVEQLDANPLLTTGSKEPRFEVGADGYARLELEPTSQAGFAVLHLRFSERRTQELRVWLEPAARDFIMVGVASGTVAHNKLSQKLEQSPALLAELAREDIEDGTTESGRVSFFAKGRIRGDYLLTVAYDSERDREAARERLKGVIEPDKYYTLYGDGTEPRDEAASGEKLYLKLERRQFVALFGDYDTGLTVTELGRYSRSLTGLKADYAGERVAVTAFAARTDLGQVRDQIPADGTSGSYQLSRAPLVVGSDKLRVEIRDRFNPERIVSVRQLNRFLDYRIDYDSGALRFREPLAARDRDFNPVTIVIDYETPGQGVESTSAGARVSLHAKDGVSEIGATAIQDGALDGNSRLYALDAKWQFTPETELRAEIARSQSDDPNKPTDATGWLAELTHIDERLEARAYARSEDSGFGIGQQFIGLGGSRKFGADVRWQWNERWSLQTQTFVQDSLETDASRQLAQAEFRYQDNSNTLSFGIEHANDQGPDGAERRSDNLTLAGSKDLFDRKLTLRATASTAIGNDASVDYPARSLLGVDYHLPRATTLFAEWEHGSGAQLDTDMTRIGLRSQPFDRTQVVSSVTQTQTEYGPRVASNLGLTQGWQFSERWSLEGGLEQSNTLRGPNLVPQNPDLPLAAGSVTDDFLAVFGGLQYHQGDWTAATRLERRTADSEDKWLATAGVYRAERAGHALSLVGVFEQRDALTGEDNEQSDLRFSWAYRPDDKRWIVLNRLDLRRDAREGALSKYENLKLVDNLHANWQWNLKTQIGLQLGFKRAISTLDGARYGANSLLFGVNVRRDVTARFDVGLHASSLRNLAASASVDEFGFDIGFAPARNLWLALGYNLRGFDERDFATGRAQHQGPYLQLRLKFDQDTFKDLRLDSLRPSGR